MHSTCTKRASSFLGGCVVLLGALSAAASDRPSSLETTYIANEGFLIAAGGKRVLVDPLFDVTFGRYLAPTPAQIDQLTRAQEPFANVDVLLVTHPHADHFNAKLVTAYLRSNPRCQLIAHTETVNQLRKDEGFARIAGQVREARLEPGARERIAANGVVVDALCLLHMRPAGVNLGTRPAPTSLAFIVDLGGARFLHMGDATVELNTEQLKAFPFDAAPIDLLFLAHFDRSQTAQRLIAETIKPRQVVAMHLPAKDLADEWKQTLAAYPGAAFFEQTMEHRSFPTSAEERLRIWVDTRSQPAECAVVRMREALDQQPGVSAASSPRKAQITVALTSCRERAVAAIPPPGSKIAGREYVIKSQVTGRQATTELRGVASDSWADAARDLCRAIVAWYARQARSR
jgi:L-ascorbate metabolism protein UlaG (beta-lactamase superfamily)